MVSVFIKAVHESLSLKNCCYPRYTYIHTYMYRIHGKSTGSYKVFVKSIDHVCSVYSERMKTLDTFRP